MLLDLIVAWRSLRRSPAFVATAVLTFAVGIGGSTALFSIVDAVLLRPLPFDAPERLVRVWESSPGDGRERAGVSVPNVQDWQARSTVFEKLVLFATDAEPAVLGVSDVSIQARQTVVTTGFFSVLGVRPKLGGDFSDRSTARTPLEGTEVMLSHALWQSAFGGAPGIVGKTVRIEGAAGSVVVGVMPPGATFPTGTDFWTALPASRVAWARRDDRSYEALGRLRPGVALARARTDMQAIAHVLAVEHPDVNTGWTAVLMPLHESETGHHRLGLLTLFAAVAFVMLVGCANLSNLFLARGLTRRGELAIRAALGASRLRIARLFAAEISMLACLGGLAGWLCAAGILPILVGLAGDNVPRATDATLSTSALLYGVAAVTVAAVLAAVAPAFRLSRTDLRTFGVEGGRATRSSADARSQRVVVAGELAVCLVLIVCAMLFLQTFMRLKAVDLGFAHRDVLSIDLRMPLYRTLAPNRWQLLARDASEVLQRVRVVPGVQAAALTSDVPLLGATLAANVTLRGDTRTRQAQYHRVSPDYFTTMGMTLVEGRDFSDADESELARLPSSSAVVSREGVVIVSEAAARTFWPSGDALGQHLSTSLDARISSRRVVGVVRSVRVEAIHQAPSAEVYVPYLEDPSFAMTLLVRTAVPSERIVLALRGEIRAVSADFSAADVRPLGDVVTTALATPRFRAVVVSAFAGVALLLAAVGVFGVFAFDATVRGREIGIRLALGATGRDVTWLFLTEAAIPLAVGIALGTMGSLVAGRLTEALLFGVAPIDPVSYGVGAAALVLVGGTASYLPVRRVLRTDPLRALRA